MIKTSNHLSGSIPFLESLLRSSFLENGEPSTIFMKLGEAPISQKGYESVRWPRLNPMKTTLSQATLTEGVVPDGHDNTVSVVEATPVLLGDYTKISDLMSMETLVDIISAQGKELYNNAKRIIDEHIQDTLESDTNVPVMYAGTATARDELTSSDVMTLDLVTKGVTFLTVQGVTNEKFKVIMHPSVFRDFCKSGSTNDWLNRVIYDNYQGIKEGYVMSIENFEIYLSSNVKTVEVTPSGGTAFKMYPTYVLRRGAYGTSSLSSLQTCFKPYGSAGTADPLNQIATIGWKAYFGCALLNPFFLVRLETRSTTDFAWQETLD